MAIPRRTFVQWAAASAAAGALPFARAQGAWPSKPIRIVVPYDAGGLSDVTARNIGKDLSARLGQPVVIENKPGATQVIGATFVQKAPADGYTLFFASLTSMVLNKYGFSRLPYDPQKDFQPLSLVTQTPLFLYVNDKFPAKNLQEFLREVKSKPGVYSYASLGQGSSYHVVMEMFKAANGLDIKHVPYKGSAPGMMALLKDEVQVMFDVGGISTQYVHEGKLRALAVTGSRRATGVPDVPTLAELGIPGFELNFWFGLVAPAGTPKPVVDRLSTEIAQIVQSPDFRERASKAGYYAVSTTPAEFSALIESDLGRWEKGFKAARSNRPSCERRDSGGAAVGLSAARAALLPAAGRQAVRRHRGALRGRWRLGAPRFDGERPRRDPRRARRPTGAARHAACGDQLHRRERWRRPGAGVVPPDHVRGGHGACGGAGARRSGGGHLSGGCDDAHRWGRAELHSPGACAGLGIPGAFAARARAIESRMPYTLSHPVLDEILRKNAIKPNDLAGIDRLFGGADGYYWYHTMRHLCPRGQEIVWASTGEIQAALQGYEDETAAEDEVKPQQLKDSHLAAIARLLEA